MDINALTQKAKQVISDIIYMTVATADADGEPWNSPVYSAYDEEYNFYWVSWAENQHSKNISSNGKAFVVIYDSTVPESTGFGVYMKGSAVQLTKKDLPEMLKALTLLARRKNTEQKKPTDFLALLPRRVYKFVPEQIWVNADGAIKGNFVDQRIDITSGILKNE